MQASDRFNINSQLEHLQAKYVGTGHADLNRLEIAMRLTWGTTRCWLTLPLPRMNLSVESATTSCRKCCCLADCLLKEKMIDPFLVSAPSIQFRDLDVIDVAKHLLYFALPCVIPMQLLRNCFRIQGIFSSRLA